MQKEEAKKDNTKLMVVGGVVVIITAAGIYYLYSKNVLISDYLKLVKDYEREYKEYGADGEIDADERAILENKIRAMETLEEEIKSKGFIIDLITALATLGIIVIAYKVTSTVLKYILRRWPPKPPNFICPECGKDLYTDHRLKRHIEEEHPVVDPEPAADVWPLIQQLPQWIIDLIGVVGGITAELAVNITKAWEDIPLEVQIMLIVTIIIAIAIIIAFSFGFLSPELAPIAVGLALCL